jgi:hypothetical protein
MAFCGNCGEAIVGADRFCRSCGHAVPPKVAADVHGAASRTERYSRGPTVDSRPSSRPPRRGPSTGLTIALGVVAAVLLVFFLAMIWAANTAQHNLDAWTGDPMGAPNPGAFGPPAVIAIVAFLVVVVVLIVRLVLSDRAGRE